MRLRPEKPSSSWTIIAPKATISRRPIAARFHCSVRILAASSSSLRRAAGWKGTTERTGAAAAAGLDDFFIAVAGCYLIRLSSQVTKTDFSIFK